MPTQTCPRCGATTEARHCPQCGLDRDPGAPADSENARRLAGDREHAWLQPLSQDVDAKPCPDCAERVQAAAHVCRYCGHRFDGAAAAVGPAAAPHAASAPPRKSPAGAAALSFLFAGLGHLYLREYGRGVVILASVLMAAGALALIGAGATLFTAPLLAVAAHDAYVGARAFNGGSRPRQVTGPLWGAAGVALSALINSAVAGSDGSGEAGRLDADAVEAEIRPELERQLQEKFPSTAVTVDAVDCVSNSGGGSCVAEISEGSGSAAVNIAYTVDSATGEFVWSTQ